MWAATGEEAKQLELHRLTPGHVGDREGVHRLGEEQVLACHGGMLYQLVDFTLGPQKMAQWVCCPSMRSTHGAKWRVLNKYSHHSCRS